MKKLDLSGRWRLSNAGKTISIDAAVPGETHSALLAAGKIPDPYYGTNELDLQWIGREDWVYSRTFEIDDELLAERSVFLHCDSLDTIAEVFINGSNGIRGARVGKSDNMFVRNRFEVRKHLRAGTNEIVILFRSAEKAAVAAARRLPYDITPGSHPVQSPHRNLIRKAQCHGGWDWGCCLMVAGIYGDIYLGATSLGRIEYVYTEQAHAKGRCAVTVNVEVDSPLGGRTTLDVQLGDASVSRNVTLKKGLNTLSARLVVKDPKLWWPNGYGDQPMYDMTVRVAGDEARRKLGLRKLDLISEADRAGKSMVFRVNGVDVFCKGANWIPADALPQRESRAILDDLLTSAVAANMNMLRVWGGGKYESDDFYELCDAKGLLVWQDFMFSCALYPADAKFLAGVEREVRHQVKRLRDHPCLALWCGNNENLAYVRDPYTQRKITDYDRLYEGTIGRVVDECDQTRTYWPSSPCGGRDDFADCFHDYSRGDMHYWGVWHRGEPFETFRKITPRFCSEFGYQSVPSMDAVRSFAGPDDLNLTSPVMEHHQRHRSGNSKIIEMFSRYFRMPEGFENFAYLSQVQQAVAIRTAVEYWRTLRPHCMGTLYWQINDNWPVNSWSSIEYGGKWKLLHYAAKRFFAPLIVTAVPKDDDRVEIWVVNDTQQAHKAAVRIQAIDFAGKVLARRKLVGQVPAGSAKRLGTYKSAELLARPADGFVMMDLAAGAHRHRNCCFLAKYNECNLAKSNVKTSVRKAACGFAVDLRTDRPAFFVSVNIDGIRGEFDDNCFTLLPDGPRTLIFTPKGETILSAVRSALSVKHLRATFA